jgi:hypothetical protein
MVLMKKGLVKVMPQWKKSATRRTVLVSFIRAGSEALVESQYTHFFIIAVLIMILTTIFSNPL